MRWIKKKWINISLRSIGVILMLIGAWHFFFFAFDPIKPKPGHYSEEEINKKIKSILEQKNLPLRIDLRDLIKGDWLLVCLHRPYQDNDPWFKSFPGWDSSDDSGFDFYLIEKGQTFFVDRYLYYKIDSYPLSKMLDMYEPANECMTKTGAVLYKTPIDCDALAKSARDISIPSAKNKGGV